MVALTEKQLLRALELDLAYDSQPTQEQIFRFTQKKEITPAAVLALVGFDHDEPCILYTKRTETVETHKGQMAFPGGHCEPNELEDTKLAALRETEEEVGIPQNQVQVIGRLPGLLTVTGYHIDPWVGLLTEPVHAAPLKPNLHEIADTIWVPVKRLLLPETYKKEQFPVGPRSYPIHVYQVDHYRIWGATGSMTYNFLERLKKAC